MTKFNCFKFFLISLVLAQFITPVLRAENEGIHLEISPLPITVAAQPGQTVNVGLKVRNARSEPENLKVTLKKFRMSQKNKVILEDRTAADDYFNWVRFSEDRPTIPPDRWYTVDMKIAVPKSAAFGYYYAVEFSRAKPQTPPQGQSAVEGVVALFVLLDVQAPGAKRELKVKEFSTSQAIYEFLPSTFRVKIANTGNTHASPKGNVFVASGDKQLATLTMNPGSGYVLPGSTREFGVQWKDGFPHYEAKTKNGLPQLNDRGKPEAELKWNLSNVPKFRIGKYTAKLIAIYDDGQRDVPVEGEVSFWVIPWRMLAVGIVLLGLVIIGLRSIGRSLAGKWYEGKKRL